MLKLINRRPNNVFRSEIDQIALFSRRGLCCVSVCITGEALRDFFWLGDMIECLSQVPVCEHSAWGVVLEGRMIEDGRNQRSAHSYRATVSLGSHAGGCDRSSVVAGYGLFRKNQLNGKWGGCLLCGRAAGVRGDLLWDR